MAFQIRQATIDDLDALAPLFDAYRQFYGQAENPPLARAFLLERFRHNQSMIFFARTDIGETLGFIQLYPSFSSVRCARTYILNDLFVAPAHRGQGIARALLDSARNFGRQMGAVRLTLSTAIDNRTAQALYERSGWQRDEAFVTYNLAL